ncbi:hypothetical protein [Roseomonas sp. HF4]|uniref:hypothetical protein n=1 Tax=Roseomonas sp. HF4 TaxID=2562313 RepID=UPI0010C0712E|nr:hypothetical protein [Roseomonas sp. HF4]
MIETEVETPWTGGTLIGIVGFSTLPAAFPLGPVLMAGLRARLPGVQVENMTWGPMHVVQRFQQADVPRPDRVVLVGAAAICRTPGAVAAYRWQGGALPPVEMQDRIYEAVTGIVDLENTLMIGTQFGIWPEVAWSVEADLPADTFQRMVMAESEGWADDAALAAHLGFSPAAVTAALIAATAGVLAGDATPGKRAETLVKLTAFTQNVALPVGART